ncbi:MAG: hypothetical protein ACE5H4_10580 [Candidatus Thorarchaeota archaeon]
MSLAGLAPTEKSENLIYMTFPIAFSLLVATIVTADPIFWITIIGIMSPPLTVLLYELGLDERYFKNLFTKEVLRARQLLAETFSAYNLYLTTAESRLDRPAWGEKFARDPFVEAKVYIEQTIDSYQVRRRFWRLRGTLYLRTAMVCFLITGYLLVLRILSPDIFTMVFVILLAILSIPILDRIIVLANRSRREGILVNIGSLVGYYYLQTLVARDRATDPESYASDQRKRMLLLELETLDRILARGDWIIWNSRWGEVTDDVYGVVRRDARGKFTTTVFRYWGQVVNAYLTDSDYDVQLRKFDWHVFYIYRWRDQLHDVFIEELVEELERSRIEWEEKYWKWRMQTSDPNARMPLEGTLFDPNFLLERARTVPKLDDQSRQTSIAQSLGAGISAMLTFKSGGDYDNAIEFMIEELLNPKIEGLDFPKMADLIVSYIEERRKHDLPSIFPAGSEISKLKAVTKHIDEAARVLLVVEFLRSAYEHDFLKLLNDEELKQPLFEDEAWQFASKKADDLTKGKGGKAQIRDRMKALLVERKKHIREQQSI